jgi:hypothetical protein
VEDGAARQLRIGVGERGLCDARWLGSTLIHVDGPALALAMQSVA